MCTQNPCFEPKKKKKKMKNFHPKIIIFTAVKIAVCCMSVFRNATDVMRKSNTLLSLYPKVC